MLTLEKAIITAMPSEAEMIIEKYNLSLEKEQGNLKIYSGEIHWDEDQKERLVLFLCWVGKTHAAFAATYMMENYSPEKIINIGIVGNLAPENIKIGDVIIPNTFVQHDVYIPEEIDDLKYLREPIFTEYAVGEDYNLEKFTLHLSGICATWDQFIDNADLKAEIVEKYAADIVDMEAYSIFSVLKNYNALDKALSIKSVSDWADESASRDHEANLKLAMENAVAILEFVL